MADGASEVWTNVGNFRFTSSQYPTTDLKVLKLSGRELEVLSMLASGLRAQAVANQLGLSLSTIDTFKRRIFKKLGVGSIGAAVMLYSAWLFGATVEYDPPTGPQT